jgi:hypothetical protein
VAAVKVLVGGASGFEAAGIRSTRVPRMASRSASRRPSLKRLNGSLAIVWPGRRQAFRKVRCLPYPEQLYLEIADLLSPAEVARPEPGQDT